MHLWALSVIWASLQHSALRSTLWFCSFAFTELICNWHKVSYCNDSNQSATNTQCPLPGLYRPVTSDWAERGTDALFLSSTYCSPLQKLLTRLGFLFLSLVCIFLFFFFIISLYFQNGRANKIKLKWFLLEECGQYSGGKNIKHGK